LSGEQFWLDMTEVREPGGVRLRLQGELDLGSAPIVAQRLRTLSEQRAVVVVDLDALTFIDMSGLRMLLMAAQDAASDGWELTVTRGSAAVRRLVGLVQLDQPLPLDGGSR
jgi:anti-sigma B factor antagonist